MDTAIISASSALVGSLIGGVSTFAASWLTQQRQFRAQTHLQQAAKREALYAEFIAEAAKRIADAWSHHAETTEVLAGLYSSIERMRLTSSSAVIDAADQVLRRVIEAYAAPERTFDELRKHVVSEADFNDPLRAFTEACRRELQASWS